MRKESRERRPALSAKGTAENVNYLYNKYVTWKSGSLQIEKLAHFALK